MVKGFGGGEAGDEALQSIELKKKQALEKKWIGWWRKFSRVRKLQIKFCTLEFLSRVKSVLIDLLNLFTLTL